MYDVVFVRWSQKDVAEWLETAGETGFVLFGIIPRWTPMCIKSNPIAMAAKVSAELGTIAIHILRLEQNIWEMSIFDSGKCVSSVRCDWTKSNVVIDRSRWNFNAFRDLVPAAQPGMSKQWQESFNRVRDIQLQTLERVLASDNWNYVMHDDRPDELIPLMLGLPVEDGMEFNELIKDREEDLEGFPFVYPGIVAVNV